MNQARQAEHDDQLIALWLHGRPATTRRAYARDVAHVRAHVGEPPPQVSLGELQGDADITFRSFLIRARGGCG